MYGAQVRHREHDDSQQRRSQRDCDSVEQPSSVQDPSVRAQPRQVHTHDITRVYDVTDKESFNNVKDWTGGIDKHVSDGINKILIENECGLTSEEELSTAGANEPADSLDPRRVIRVKHAIRVRRD